MILYKGTYEVVCSNCNGKYEDFVISRKTHNISNYCFYCKTESLKFTKRMENQVLSFVNNWNNKLNCKCFTTLRLRNDKKYYPGAKLEIKLKEQSKGIATVQRVTYLNIEKINDYISMLDTSYKAEECKKMIKTMYKNKACIVWTTQDLAFVLLKYDERGKGSDLFNE